MTMARWAVRIQGEGRELLRAQQVLNGAGIPSIGPVITGWGDKLDTVHNAMTAVPEAESSDAAEARVRQSLPADGEFTIESVEPFK
jgi:hypothetical protein